MDSINNLKEKFEKFAQISLISALRDDAFCCISVEPKGFALACMRKTGATLELDFIETVTCKPSNFVMELWTLVKRHDLEGVKCSWVLDPNKYQILVHDELPVKDEEFQSAVRWQIRKLLPYSIDDAIIDSFPVPPAQIANPKKMIMIVSAQASYIRPIALQITESGLHLSSIDIQELALRNITACYEGDDNAVALLYLRENTSELIITRQKSFYFSRHLDWNLNLPPNVVADQENINNHLDRLTLEMQRSFDYFQTQWRYPAPTKVLVASLKPDAMDIANYLTQRLRLQASNLNVSEILPRKNKISHLTEIQNLPIIGGILRDDLSYAPTS